MLNNYNKSCNHLLSSFISRLNFGSMRKIRYIIINYSNILIKLIKMLYKEGIIRLYILKNDKIIIYFKYYRGCRFFKFKIISKPSKRIYWSLNNLCLNYNKENINSIYILSTPIGLVTSNECLLYKPISGEVLFKIYI